MTKVFDAEGRVLKAGGVVVNDRGQILLYRNEDRGFSFPKGHLDPGDTIESAAIREVKEETGIKAEIIKALPKISYKNSNNGEDIIINMFLMTPVEGELSLEEDGDELLWADFDDAVEKLKPNDSHLYRDFSKYLSGIKGELNA